LESEQVEPTGKKVQTEVQHTLLGLDVPASHCSPVSTIPFPQTAFGAPEEKFGGGGTTGDSDGTTFLVPVEVAD